jgi:hypothetical protein
LALFAKRRSDGQSFPAAFALFLLDPASLQKPHLPEAIAQNEKGGPAEPPFSEISPVD